jgi:hypothetical protein
MQVDSSALRLAVAQRLAKEARAEEKLALLQRLQRRYVECNLPRESETRVEQSFNEQLFAQVLGYRTLLSHDSLPYHLRPKNYAAGSRRFDDFSLGTFWGDDRDLVVASAEFKDPGTDLDAPQTDRREKLSSVQQAFRAAHGFPSCTWVIVSNFRELRLFHATCETSPLVRIDLHEVRTPRQLAMLCSYFDHDALVGTGGKSGMTAALNPDHLSAPLAAAADAFRVVCTFTPGGSTIVFPLSGIYDACREAAATHLKAQRDPFDRTPNVPTKIDDGWVSVETGDVRLAMSAEGQVRCSIRHRRTSSPAQVNPDAEFWSVARNLYDFLLIVERLYATLQVPGLPTSGRLSFEMREIRGWLLLFQARDLLKETDNTNGGVAESDEIFSGDAVWIVGQNSARVAADCMGELALQFKAQEGRRVRFEHAALAKHFAAKA